MQKIYKFNQYILEKYPTVWNTKIIWMLLAGIVVHVLFFIIGYFSHANPVSLQKFEVKDDYFRGGMIFIHLIISILMIVGWLIMMFKNNAFKNFYPSSKTKLFLQFVQYFIIIFSCTTFYFSYMTGFKMFIKNKYPDKEMTGNIDVINKTIPFVSQELNGYTLDNRKYPKLFNDLYCETNINEIDRNKKYFVYYNKVYQFYSIFSKVSYKKDEYGNYFFPEKMNKNLLAYSEIKDNCEVFYFKKEVVDVSPYIKTTGLTYYNFSDVFYDNRLNDRVGGYSKDIYHELTVEDDIKNYQNKKAFEVNKSVAALLDKKNPAEVEKLLTQFLKISKEFGIRNNLEAKEWTKMIVSPQNPNFEVRYFIRKFEKTREGDDIPAEAGYEEAAVDSAAVVASNGTIVNDTVTIKTFNPEINKEISPEQFYKNNVTDYYYYTDNLKDVLTNVDTMKSYDFFSENIHIYIWIAFFLSTFIFSFRITGLKSLLFSLITAGVLTLAVTLLTVLYSVMVGGREEFFAGYFLLVLSLIILAVPVFKMNTFSKLITSIFVNISMNGFVLFVLLLFGIISLHQRADCRNTYEDCITIIEYLDFALSYIILACGFVFIYFYTSILQKWKARSQ
ncbi:hypothetical protein PFY12_00515 [Chryseobacterium camelliae]|uniref:ABC transporter permease n=1 Tax=Chryseobacterium camelliae TaxID=1265445 RepID=A0ABY7QLQ3_9FLAO|nr:hypothetical protein [Chryseobacterium camelliae]WBV60617.1 hypothetical protein PFY12_00515 [Chryseobacterium camelliae]